VKSFIAALLLSAAVMCAGARLGRTLTLPKPVTVSALMASPDAHVGKVVQVKGKVTEVCQKAGCWMQLVDAGHAIRIKVNDGDIVFPRSAIGKTAVAEGILRKTELTWAQAVARARHEAEERGVDFLPESVKSGATFYEIQGTGAIISD
jgi:hypothetical protein